MADTKTLVYEISKMMKDIKVASDPRLWVFEYSPHVPTPTSVYVMDRSMFEDGRPRVIAHPDLQEKLERALAEWSPAE